jgi:hypothetical protein
MSETQAERLERERRARVKAALSGRRTVLRQRGPDLRFGLKKQPPKAAPGDREGSG